MGKMTIQDIARKANVSKSTVSRYLNGGSIGQETQDRIRKIIEEYDYRPNAFARLSAKQSGMIGVVVPTLNSKVTSRVVTSIDRYLRDRNYVSIIRNSDHDIRLELENLQKLITLGVDGILLSAISITEEHRRIIESCPVPVVVLAQEYPEGICIVNDEYAAGRFMGEYIGHKGHQKVGLITVDDSDQAVGQLRTSGVLDGLRETGVENTYPEYTNFSFVDGQNAMGSLLEHHPDLDAVICATDRLAFGAYRILHQNGYEIPKDVSVVGFGGYEESELISPELTSLMFDSCQMGELGAKTVTDLIEGMDVPSRQVITYTFLERYSVK